MVVGLSAIDQFLSMDIIMGIQTLPVSHLQNAQLTALSNSDRKASLPTSFSSCPSKNRKVPISRHGVRLQAGSSEPSLSSISIPEQGSIDSSISNGIGDGGGGTDDVSSSSIADFTRLLEANDRIELQTSIVSYWKAGPWWDLLRPEVQVWEFVTVRGIQLSVTMEFGGMQLPVPEWATFGWDGWSTS